LIILIILGEEYKLWNSWVLYFNIILWLYFFWPLLHIQLYLRTALALSSSMNKVTGYGYRRPGFDHQQSRYFLFFSAYKGLVYLAPTNLHSAVASPRVLSHSGVEWLDHNLHAVIHIRA
jgi:hypothetical protein